MKPSVAFFLPSLSGGGAERIVLILAREALASGYAVDILLVRKEGHYLPQVPPGARIVDLHGRPSGRLSTVGVLPALLGYLYKNRPVAVISSMTQCNAILCLAAFFAPFIQTKIILSEHINQSAYRARHGSIKDKILFLMVPFLYRRADAIVCVSQGVADGFRHKGLAKEVRIIYPPIDVREIEQLAAGDAAVPDMLGDFILGVGRLDPQKNFPLLVRAFASVHKRHPTLKLAILGEGDERTRLEGLIRELGLSESVSLPGFVDNPFIYMKKARLFCLSSDYEGYPTVILQALACGTPVVSTDCPSGPKEALEGGKYGALVPCNDDEALARAIEDALARPHNAEALRARAREFSASAIANQYFALFG